jgi:hypothetical protein
MYYYFIHHFYHFIVFIMSDHTDIQYTIIVNIIYNK